MIGPKRFGAGALLTWLFLRCGDNRGASFGLQKTPSA